MPGRGECARSSTFRPWYFYHVELRSIHTQVDMVNERGGSVMEREGIAK